MSPEAYVLIPIVLKNGKPSTLDKTVLTPSKIMFDSLVLTVAGIDSDRSIPTDLKSSSLKFETFNTFKSEFVSPLSM